MSSHSSEALSRPATHRRSTFHIFLLLACLFPLVVGCQGCTDDSAEQDKDQQAAKQPIIVGTVSSLPGDQLSDRGFAKPGHWGVLQQSWQANTDDVRGVIEIGPPVRRSGNQVQDAIQLPAIRTSRPAVLPKGQSKLLDTRVLAPDAVDSQSRALDFDITLRSPTLSATISGSNRALIPLRSHEYYYVVLTSRPQQFASLQLHDWVQPPNSNLEAIRDTHYRVVFPAVDGLPQLPDTFFEWTSIAYVLWDDINPDQLTLDQRRALRDWMHWGGQMIVNGPGSAQALSDSDLADLLPMFQIRGEGLESPPLVSIVQNWSVPTDKSQGTVVGLLENGSERVGVGGQLTESAKFLENTDEMIVELWKGRGRVSMTRFDITSNWLVKWDSAANFHNGVLMRRPPRQYSVNEGVLSLAFAGKYLGRERDATLNTRLRIMSRDNKLDPNSPSLSDSGLSTNASPFNSNNSETKDSTTPISNQSSTELSWSEPGYPFSPGISMGEWRDSSDIVAAAVKQLRAQAGITIPSVNFILKAMGIYLAILIPLNYIVFRLLGKLEWAWIAVPIVGIAGAVWIARSAQLDIGFARSRTEIAVLELQPHYERAHLSRFVAIYNSLSTNYDFLFAQRESVATPVWSMAKIPSSTIVFQQAFSEGVALTGISIPSNQTATFRAEQMIEVGGGIHWASTGNNSTAQDEPDAIQNESQLTLYDTVVIQRQADGTIHHAFIGMFEANSAVKPRFLLGLPSYNEELPLGVHNLLTDLTRGIDLKPGESRLYGRVEDIIAGMEIEPRVSQSKHQTLVIANLGSPQLPPPGIDINLRTDINEDDLIEEEIMEELGEVQL